MTFYIPLVLLATKYDIPFSQLDLPIEKAPAKMKIPFIIRLLYFKRIKKLLNKLSVYYNIYQTKNTYIIYEKDNTNGH